MEVSKGLEFSVVALSGIGLMPGAGEDEREEARLVYVAATRVALRMMPATTDVRRSRWACKRQHAVHGVFPRVHGGTCSTVRFFRSRLPTHLPMNLEPISHLKRSPMQNLPTDRWRPPFDKGVTA